METRRRVRERRVGRERWAAWIKTVFVGLVLLSLAVDAGCGSESKRLVGTWSGSTGCGNMTLTFNQDGTGKATFLTTDSFRWRVEDGKLHISEPDGSNEEAFDYEFNDQGDLVITSEEYGPIVFRRVK